MNSLIETARQAHEEVDLYEQALAAIFLQPDKTVRRRCSFPSLPVEPARRLLQPSLNPLVLQPRRQHKHKLDKEHRASDILDRIVARKQFLSEHYADEHGCVLLSARLARRDELC